MAAGGTSVVRSTSAETSKKSPPTPVGAILQEEEGAARTTTPPSPSSRGPDAGHSGDKTHEILNSVKSPENVKKSPSFLEWAARKNRRSTPPGAPGGEHSTAKRSSSDGNSSTKTPETKDGGGPAPKTNNSSTKNDNSSSSTKSSRSSSSSSSSLDQKKASDNKPLSVKDIFKATVGAEGKVGASSPSNTAVRGNTSVSKIDMRSASPDPKSPGAPPNKSSSTGAAGASPGPTSFPKTPHDAHTLHFGRDGETLGKKRFQLSYSAFHYHYPTEETAAKVWNEKTGLRGSTSSNTLGDSLFAQQRHFQTGSSKWKKFFGATIIDGVSSNERSSRPTSVLPADSNLTVNLLVRCKPNGGGGVSVTSGAGGATTGGAVTGTGRAAGIDGAPAYRGGALARASGEGGRSPRGAKGGINPYRVSYPVVMRR